MALEILDVLESRIKALRELVRELKRDNAMLVQRLHDAEEQLSQWTEDAERWRGERKLIKARITSVLSELDSTLDQPDNLIEIYKHTMSNGKE